MNIPFFFPWDISTASIVGAVGVVDAIKVSVATVHTSATDYTGVALDGTLAGGPYSLTRSVSVTTSTHTGTYNIVDPIVFTGTDLYGNVQTENLFLTLVNGNETVAGVKAFKTVTNIHVPIQVDTLGTFKFGVQDAFVTDQCVDFRVGTSGNLKVTHNDGTVDTLAVGNLEHLSISPAKIWGTSATTAQNLILFRKK
jgi:hypothetical protein